MLLTSRVPFVPPHALVDGAEAEVAEATAPRVTAVGFEDAGERAVVAVSVFAGPEKGDSVRVVDARSGAEHARLDHALGVVVELFFATTATGTAHITAVASDGAFAVWASTNTTEPWRSVSAGFLGSSKASRLLLTRRALSAPSGWPAPGLVGIRRSFPANQVQLVVFTPKGNDAVSSLPPGSRRAVSLTPSASGSPGVSANANATANASPSAPGTTVPNQVTLELRSPSRSSSSTSTTTAPNTRSRPIALACAPGGVQAVALACSDGTLQVWRFSQTDAVAVASAAAAQAVRESGSRVTALTTTTTTTTTTPRSSLTTRFADWGEARVPVRGHVSTPPPASASASHAASRTEDTVTRVASVSWGLHTEDTMLLVAHEQDAAEVSVWAWRFDRTNPDDGGALWVVRRVATYAPSSSVVLHPFQPLLVALSGGALPTVSLLDLDSGDPAAKSVRLLASSSASSSWSSTSSSSASNVVLGKSTSTGGGGGVVRRISPGMGVSLVPIKRPAYAQDNEEEEDENAEGSRRTRAAAWSLRALFQRRNPLPGSSQGPAEPKLRVSAPTHVSSDAPPSTPTAAGAPQTTFDGSARQLLRTASSTRGGLAPSTGNAAPALTRSASGRAFVGREPLAAPTSGTSASTDSAKHHVELHVSRATGVIVGVATQPTWSCVSARRVRVEPRDAWGVATSAAALSAPAGQDAWVCRMTPANLIRDMRMPKSALYDRCLVRVPLSPGMVPVSADGDPAAPSNTNNTFPLDVARVFSMSARAVSTRSQVLVRAAARATASSSSSSSSSLSSGAVSVAVFEEGAPATPFVRLTDAAFLSRNRFAFLVSNVFVYAASRSSRDPTKFERVKEKIALQLEARRVFATPFRAGGWRSAEKRREHALKVQAAAGAAAAATATTSSIPASLPDEEVEPHGECVMYVVSLVPPAPQLGLGSSAAAAAAAAAASSRSSSRLASARDALAYSRNIHPVYGTRDPDDFFLHVPRRWTDAASSSASAASAGSSSAPPSSSSATAPASASPRAPEGPSPRASKRRVSAFLSVADANLARGIPDASMAVPSEDDETFRADAEAAVFVLDRGERVVNVVFEPVPAWRKPHVGVLTTIRALLLTSELKLVREAGRTDDDTHHLTSVAWVAPGSLAVMDVRGRVTYMSPTALARTGSASPAALRPLASMDVLSPAPWIPTLLGAGTDAQQLVVGCTPVLGYSRASASASALPGSGLRVRPLFPLELLAVGLGRDASAKWINTIASHALVRASQDSNASALAGWTDNAALALPESVARKLVIVPHVLGPTAVSYTHLTLPTTSRV